MIFDSFLLVRSVAQRYFECGCVFLSRSDRLNLAGSFKARERATFSRVASAMIDGASGQIQSSLTRRGGVGGSIPGVKTPG
jgi:hypothetical protein